MTSGTRIGILGGTFDPVHAGHVDTALAAQRALALDRVLVMPSGTPPHRPSQPSASRFHRFAMAALAVNGPAGAGGQRPRDWRRPSRATPSTRWRDCTKAASPRRRFSSSPVPTRSRRLTRGAAIRRSSRWRTSSSSRGQAMRRRRSPSKLPALADADARAPFGSTRPSTAQSALVLERSTPISRGAARRCADPRRLVHRGPAATRVGRNQSPGSCPQPSKPTSCNTGSTRAAAVSASCGKSLA